VISQFLAAAAAVGLMGAGFANASQTRSFEAMTGQTAMFGSGEGGGAEGGNCRVDVVRSGAAGSADVTRQTFSDGSCVCTVTTGPASSNGSAETVVTNLLRDRECAAAPVGGYAGSEAGAAAGGGGMGGGAVIGVLFGVAALGVGVAAGGGGKNDSAG
jgi:hypothetical protein